MNNRVNVKFMGVDLLDTMSRIVEAHMKFYKSDFYADDMRHLQETAAEQTQDGKCFLWLCRTHGTWLLDERNTFIRTTFEYNTFTFYAENHVDEVLCYLVEVTGCEGDRPIGNLYALDYRQYACRVAAAALEPSTLILNYEKGTRCVRGDTPLTTAPDAELGALVAYEYLPESQTEWDYLLLLEKKKRERFTFGNLGPYLAELR